MIYHNINFVHVTNKIVKAVILKIKFLLRGINHEKFNNFLNSFHPGNQLLLLNIFFGLRSIV